MNYTEELLLKADEVIPRVTLEDFENDSNSKVMIDVRQYEAVSYTHLTLPTILRV